MAEVHNPLIVALDLPDAGTYTIVVHGWQTDGPDASYTLFNWTFGLVDDRGNMTVTAPASATLGATETIAVDWMGLGTGTKYLGAVSHSDGASETSSAATAAISAPTTATAGVPRRSAIHGITTNGT